VVDADAYDHYTRQIVRWAERRSDVLGVVALGSTAATDHRPDRHSDHDLFVVTVDGAAQALRDDVGWLPDAHRIALCHSETRHGRGVVYDDGHLVEIAVFEPGELHVCRVNAFRVLHDTGDVAAWITALASTTTATQAAADPDGTERFAAFAQQMIIGINRNARGEHVSANARVRGQALELLLSLVSDLVPAQPDVALDNLDPHRRFELAHPEIGRRLVTALDGPLDALIHALVAVLEEHVVPRLRIDTSRPLAALHRVLGDPSPGQNRSPADPVS
jgi:hypothetical protein